MSVQEIGIQNVLLIEKMSYVAITNSLAIDFQFCGFDEDFCILYKRSIPWSCLNKFFH